MSEATGVPVVAAASAEETVRGSDLVGTVTTATQPLFDAEWLAPGTHINAAGSNALIRQELSEATLRRCALIAVDAVPTALAEAGDLLPLAREGQAARAATGRTRRHPHRQACRANFGGTDYRLRIAGSGHSGSRRGAQGRRGRPRRGLGVELPLQ